MIDSVIEVKIESYRPARVRIAIADIDDMLTDGSFKKRAGIVRARKKRS